MKSVVVRILLTLVAIVAATSVAIFGGRGVQQAREAAQRANAVAGPQASQLPDAGPRSVASGAVPSRTESVMPSAQPLVSMLPEPPASPSSSSPPSAARKKATGPRQVTFVNAVDQTIWVASGEQTAKPALTTTGWVVKAGRQVTITVPDHWNGRFWGRTGCSFDAGGHGRCRTGDCGKFQCTGYGRIPATLAEFNLNSWQNMDFYDVSLVDGSNLPMYINLTHGRTKDPISASGCSKAGCTRAVPCPSALKVGGGGCESPCGVFNTDQYCCRAQWASRSACDPTKWPVNYAAIFKKAEPFAYSYVDDDATSTFTCTGECGYRITFGRTP
jgi:hypothetical protein